MQATVASAEVPETHECRACGYVAYQSEGNIRRWRGEIASLINDDPGFVLVFATEDTAFAEIQEILKLHHCA